MKEKIVQHNYLEKLYKVPHLECFRVTKNIDFFFDEYKEQYIKLLGEVVDNEYSIRSTGMSRGYYCPSPILDLVVGGLKRGRLSKKPPLSGGEDVYRYGFNELGQLIIAETLDEISLKEILIYQNNIVRSVEFYMSDREMKEILGYTECRYEDNKIKTCIMVGVYDGGSYRREDYYYSEKNLDYVEEVEFPFRNYTFDESDNLKRWLLESHSNEGEGFEEWYEKKEQKKIRNRSLRKITDYRRYYFNHDEKGYVSEYHIVEYYNGEIKKAFWDDHYFKVSLKRKIDVYNIQENTTELFQNEESNDGISLTKLMFDQLKSVIKQWREQDIYAISFYVEEDMEYPAVTVGYNTLSHFQNSITLAEDEKEAKWNYAYWLQNQEYILGYDDTADIIIKWVQENGLNNEDLYEEYDEQNDDSIPAYLVTREFINQLVIVVQELHQERIFEDILHREIPIIIHDLEYSLFFLKKTKEANPEGLVDEFLNSASCK